MFGWLISVSKLRVVGAGRGGMVSSISCVALVEEFVSARLSGLSEDCCVAWWLGGA